MFFWFLVAVHISSARSTWDLCDRRGVCTVHCVTSSCWSKCRLHLVQYICRQSNQSSSTGISPYASVLIYYAILYSNWHQIFWLVQYYCYRPFWSKWNKPNMFICLDNNYWTKWPLTLTLYKWSSRVRITGHDHMMRLKNCSRLRIEVRPTVLGFGIGVRVDLDLWPWPLTFNPRRAMVITHTHAIGRAQRSVGSIDRVEIDRQMDGQTEAIALPPVLASSEAY